MKNLTYPNLMKKAWPIILANASVPLLGIVDTAVIGNTGSIPDLGAIALGSLIFSFVYWSFGFLRMGTTGFAARAAGRGDEEEIRAVLGRSILMGTCLGIVLIFLQYPIGNLSFLLLSGSKEVESLASTYFYIRIWGAPATLCTFAVTGMLIGLGRSKRLLWLQLTLNGLNIALDILFAGILGYGAEGIAMGTLVAEWLTLFLAIHWIIQELQQRRKDEGLFWPKALILDPNKLKSTMVANFDIMIRTLLLVCSFGWFTNQSAQYGNDVLAASHILLQLISFSAFFLDGYAFVAEALVGQALGAKDKLTFDEAVGKTTFIAFVTAVCLGLSILLAGDFLVAALTDLLIVREKASEMIWLAAIYVMISFGAFQLDGIFIGASATKQMRNSALISTASFLAAWWPLSSIWGVFGLWYSFIFYLTMRAFSLLIFYPALRRSATQ